MQLQRALASGLVVLMVLSLSPGPVAAGTDGRVAQQDPVDCEFPVSATDATGTEVTVTEEPERVVALGPSAAQTMWEIGARDRVVGLPVNEFTAYLNGSESRTNVVGSDGAVIQEQVVAADPDLVLAPNIIENETVRSLREAGLTVFRFGAANSLSSVYEKTRLTGRLVGAYDSASRRSARMEATVGAVADAVGDEPSPDVLYVFGPSGFTAGPDTFIGELIERAGGTNVAAAANISRYGAVSPEVVVRENPEYIVLPEGRLLPDDSAYNETTATQAEQVIRVNDNFVNQPGPRTTVPLVTMAGAFHDAVVDRSTVENATIEPYRTCTGVERPNQTADTPTATPTATETATTTTGGAGPGVGVAGVVAALAGVLAAFGWRR